MSRHKPQLDDFTPAEIRVLAEQLLHTMDMETRGMLMEAYPSLYVRLYPTAANVCAERFARSVNR